MESFLARHGLGKFSELFDDLGVESTRDLKFINAQHLTREGEMGQTAAEALVNRLQQICHKENIISDEDTETDEFTDTHEEEDAHEQDWTYTEAEFHRAMAGPPTHFTNPPAAKKMAVLDCQPESGDSRAPPLPACPSTPVGGDMKRNRGSVTVEIVRAQSMPNMDVVGLSDYYVLAHWQRSDSPPLGGVVKRTLTRRDSLDPVWHENLSFPFVPADSDVLHLEVYNECLGNDKFVGRATVGYGALIQTGPPWFTELPIKTSRPGSSITVKMVAQVRGADEPSWQRSKIFYLIRHGQSKWNEAKSGKNIGAMVKQTDHALTAQGVHEAILLHKRWSQTYRNEAAAFKSAGRVVSSPLTRAVQTALVACAGLPALRTGGLTLLRNLREKKNFGSFDTVSSSSGDAIRARAERELATVIEKNSASAYLRGLSIDPYDAVNNWWTPLSDSETTSDVKQRLAALWQHLRYTKEPVQILVGHSHFFRAMMQHHLSPILRASRPRWADMLCKYTLENGACMRVEVVWDPAAIAGKTAAVSPLIVQVEMAFGSRLKIVDKINAKVNAPTRVLVKRLEQGELDDYLGVPDWTDKYFGSVSRLQTAVRRGHEDLPATGVLIKSHSMSAKTGVDTMFHVTVVTDASIPQPVPKEAKEEASAPVHEPDQDRTQMLSPVPESDAQVLLDRVLRCGVLFPHFLRQFVFGGAMRLGWLQNIVRHSKAKHVILTRGRAKEVCVQLLGLRMRGMFDAVIDVYGAAFRPRQMAENPSDVTYGDGDLVSKAFSPIEGDWDEDCSKDDILSEEMAGGWQRALPGWLAGPKDTPDKVVYIDDNPETESLPSTVTVVSLPKEGSGIAQRHLRDSGVDMRRLSERSVVVWDYDCTLTSIHMYKLTRMRLSKSWTRKWGNKLMAWWRERFTPGGSPTVSDVPPPGSPVILKKQLSAGLKEFTRLFV